MQAPILRLSVFLVTLLLCRVCHAQDVVELLTGVKVEGQVKAIDKEKKLVTFSAKLGGQTLERVYPYAKIHAVTYQGRRHILTEKTADSETRRTSDKATGSGPANTRRTPAEVKLLIEQAGKTPPDWYDSVPVEHPPTLDLSWPPKPPEGWNNQKNVGQYLWDIIHPNPSRWKSGVRLIHHLLSLHQDDSEKRQRAMKTLGGMYFNLFQDYARAAYCSAC